MKIYNGERINLSHADWCDITGTEWEQPHISRQFDNAGLVCVSYLQKTHEIMQQGDREIARAYIHSAILMCERGEDLGNRILEETDWETYEEEETFERNVLLTATHMKEYMWQILRGERNGTEI